jgi:hypothetical protein
MKTAVNTDGKNTDREKGKSVFPPSAFTKINYAIPIPKGE